MTKAASLSIGLTFLIGTALVSWSQSTPTDSAVNEAIRRQAATITLRQKLADAQVAESRRDLATAAKLYEDAYKLVGEIGDPTTPEAAATVSGLTAVQLENARAARARGDLIQAKSHAARVLKVNPKSEAGIAMMRQIEKELAEQRGHIPTEETVKRAIEVQNEKIDANTLVQNGKLLLEMGKLDEAEAELNRAIKIDPENRAAFYYLSLLKEKRYNEAERRRDQTSKDALVKVEQDWAPQPKRDLLPVPNPYARTEQINTGKGRQSIVSKLSRIRLDSVGPWDNLPLSEVIKFLSEEARKRDPEKRGLNFIVNPTVEVSLAAALPPGAPPVVDPNTGLPIAPVGAPTETVDINAVAIKINPALTDVRLADVLDAITKVADKPIKFSIEDYAIVFSHKGQEVQQLYNRTFHVDPNTFYQGLESVGSFDVGGISSSSGGGGGSRGGGGGSRGGGGGGQSGQGGGDLGVPRVYVAGGGGGGGGGGQGGGGGISGGGGGVRYVTRTNGTDEASSAVRNFFTTLGVDLGSPTAVAAGKSVFFNERGGVLLVRATLQELDIIEAAIQVLNVTPPQINIKAKFAEITQNDSKALGFDWYLGNFLMNNNSIIGSGGTQPSFNGAPSPANPEGTFPGSSFFGTDILPSGSDGLVSGGLRNVANAPALTTFTGILTDPQFRVVIRAMEQRDGVDLLNAPEVTTPSGRQAQIQIVDLQTIVTGTSLNQTGSGSGNTGTGTSVNTGSGGGVVATTIEYPVDTLPFGTTLDVIPYVSADGYTVQMTIIPTITEFVGYDDPGQFVPTAQSGAAGGSSSTLGLPLTAVLPLPRIRLRQVTTSAIVWDGQTIVLGGLLREDVARLKDKVPVLGDLPLVGKLFRSEASSTKKKNLVIFVTPTIIDPAGNRMHSDDEMPFGPNAGPNVVPPQKPFAPTQ